MVTIRELVNIIKMSVSQAPDFPSVLSTRVPWVSECLEHMTSCCSVSTVAFEHVFIFWIWSFNISIAFRLRWIQVPSIYRKNFPEVKYLHEHGDYISMPRSSMHSPLLNFFSKSIQNFQTGVCKQYFFRRPSINYSGEIFVITCSRRNFMGGVGGGGGGQLSRDSYSGKDYSGENLGGNCSGGNFMGVNCSGGNCPGGNYSGVIVQRQRSGSKFLGRIS